MRLRLAVWAATAQEARGAAVALVGHRAARHVLCVGNRWPDAARGRTLDAVLVLPGALSIDVQRDLAIAVHSTGGAWVDLRTVENVEGAL